MSALITHSSDFILRGSRSPKAQIWSIGGGKGGVGKSFLSSSLALFLTRQGHKVLLCDLDFGAANVHTYLNEPIPRKGFRDFLNQDEKPLSDFILPTKVHNLFLLSAADHSFDGFQLSVLEKSRIIANLYKLEFDYILLDLSAGTHETTLDFFLMAHVPIVTMTPEPVSIENGYRFMKASFYRKLKRYEKQLHLKQMIADLMAHKDSIGIRTPSDLLRTLEQRAQDEGARLRQLMQNFGFYLIINQARTHKDVDLGWSIQTVARRYFGLQADYVGHIEHDNAVWQCLRKQTHVLLEAPHSHTFSQLIHITRKLSEVQIQHVAA